MVAEGRSGRERFAAAGIFALAVVIAWMIIDRPDETRTPKKTEVAPTRTDPASAATVSPVTIASALAIEIVQISEPAVAPPTLRPPEPAQETAAPPQPESPSVQYPVMPTPVHAAPAIPDVVPLRPTAPAPIPEPEVMPAILSPDVAAPAAVVPLRPTPPKPQEETHAMRLAQRPDSQERRTQINPMRPTPVLPRPIPAPERAPEKAIARRVPVAPQPSQVPKAESAQNVSAVVGEGRAFLKILEQGSGPGIEIRWPSDPAQRDQLYRALVQCLGMRTGLLDGQGRLYLGDGVKGQSSTLDGERYSGFVRRPEGAIAQGEQREITRVRSYHNVNGAASPARIFPRHVDAYLIGGLRGMVGQGYLKTKSIRATYRLKNNQPIVESIVADGRRIDGAIDLSAVATSCSF